MFSEIEFLLKPILKSIKMSPTNHFCSLICIEVMQNSMSLTTLLSSKLSLKNNKK